MEGMRISVKVEKPDNYDGGKRCDINTWLFQVREHLNLTVILERGQICMQLQCCAGMRHCGGGSCVKVTTTPQIGKSLAVSSTSSYVQIISVTVGGMSLQGCTSTVKNLYS